MRLIWIFLGSLCVGLGAAGIILPLVPTTPFLLLAAFCFARGSPKLHGWLIHHPQFGPPIQHWREHKAVSTGVKVSAGIFMLAVLLISLIMGVDRMIVIIQACIFTIVTGFLLTRPSPPLSPPPCPPAVEPQNSESHLL
ncbi:MAG: YbaN family protein [Proteobacteria bacterium]|nr:YbaN family protein [Pseudomonadota bacterium]